MASKEIAYESESVKEAAMEVGFTESFNAEEAPILDKDTALSRSFFHMSGGRGWYYSNVPARYGGPQTVFSLLERSAKEQWGRDYENEWTLVDDKDAKFIDHFVDSSGKTRLTAGKFPNPLNYTKDNYMRSPGENLEKKTGLEYKVDLPLQEKKLTEHDVKSLFIRDQRWGNYNNKDIELDYIGMTLFGIKAAVVGGLTVGAAYTLLSGNKDIETFSYFFVGGAVLTGAVTARKMYNWARNVKNDFPAKDLTLDDKFLYNRDVVRYLESELES